MKMGKSILSRLIVFCSVLAFWPTAIAVQAAVTDAPHNETNGIKCTSCHTYAFWWRYSPAKKQSNFTTLVDTLCFDCHKDAGTGPKVVTHSSVNIGSTLHNTWDRACTACHNPHNQDQLEWASSATKPYLVTGTLTGVTVVYNSVSKLTTISYSIPEQNINPKWPAVGSEADQLDWTNKSLANPGRGLILVQDTALENAKTFSIVAATATEVTIKGELTPDMIDPAYTDPLTHKRNTATCNSFGLIYGDLIRNTINGKSVKFFDPNGGFVSSGGAAPPDPTGICQVCHTETAHYRNNGTLPSGSDTHIDRNNMNCTTCHQHIKGFKGEGHDDNSFAWAGNCATCHNPGGLPVNIATGIHGGKCGLCHVSAAGGGPRKDGDPTNGIDGSAVGATNSSTCVDCHITKLNLTGATIHHTSEHGYAAAGECTHCHENSVGKLAANHENLVTADNDCSWCHTATAGTASGMPVSVTDNKVHDVCITCHKSDGSLQAAYGKAAKAIAAGSCTTCHDAYFTKHQSINHSTLVAGTANCTACHKITAGTTTGILVDATDNKVHDACSTCHDPNTNNHLWTPYGKATAMPAGGGDCNACHGAYFTKHANPNHSTHVAASANCITCHTNTAGTEISIPVDPADNKVHDDCATCHNTTNGTLLPPHGRAIAMPAGGGACEACHGDYFTTHLAPNHANRVIGSADCTSCHMSTAGTATGMPVSGIDNRVHDACSTCHKTDGTLQAPYGKAAAMPAGGGRCTDCHGDYFLKHDNIASHDRFLNKTTSSCLSCHDQSGNKDIVANIHGANFTDKTGCEKCHDHVTHAMVNGTTQGVRVKIYDTPSTWHYDYYMIGDARKHMYGTKSSCAVCHSYNKYMTMTTNHPSDDWTHIDNVGDEAECIVCHVANVAPFTDAGEVHNALNCNTCHNTTGGYVLKGSALNHTVGQPSSCSTCHIRTVYTSGGLIYSYFGSDSTAIHYSK